MSHRCCVRGSFSGIYEARRKAHAKLGWVVFLVFCVFSQVICEKADRSDIPDIDKKKYLVPADLSTGEREVGWAGEAMVERVWWMVGGIKRIEVWFMVRSSFSRTHVP